MSTSLKIGFTKLAAIFKRSDKKNKGCNTITVNDHNETTVTEASSPPPPAPESTIYFTPSDIFQNIYEAWHDPSVVDIARDTHWGLQAPRVDINLNIDITNIPPLPGVAEATPDLASVSQSLQRPPGLSGIFAPSDVSTRDAARNCLLSSRSCPPGLSRYLCRPAPSSQPVSALSGSTLTDSGDIWDASTPTLVQPPSVSLKLTDFSALRVLGQGAFGVVYKVKHKTASEPLAMKVMTRAKMFIRSYQFLMNEQRALRRVRGNQWFLQMEASFFDNFNCYLVTSYYAVGDLGGALDRVGGRFTKIRAQMYAAELLIAISSLHTYGVIHRDLKPDNIFIDATGHLVIGDFGLSAVFERTPGEILRETDPEFWADAERRGPEFIASLPMKPHLATETCGTLLYMAPEVISGKPYGYSYDWWSWAVILYQMTTGQVPFGSPDESVSDVADSITHQRLEFPARTRIDDAAISLLEMALQKNVKARPTVDAMKAHPYFADIDWVKAETRQLPVPVLASVDDVKDDKESPVDLAATGEEEATDESLYDQLLDWFPFSALNKDEGNSSKPPLAGIVSAVGRLFSKKAKTNQVVLSHQKIKGRRWGRGHGFLTTLWKRGIRGRMGLAGEQNERFAIE